MNRALRSRLLASPLLPPASYFPLAAPWVAAICAAAATFVGSWEAQRRGVLRGSQLCLAVPRGRELRTAGLSACSFVLRGPKYFLTQRQSSTHRSSGYLTVRAASLCDVILQVLPTLHKRQCSQTTLRRWPGVSLGWPCPPLFPGPGAFLGCREFPGASPVPDRP